MFKGWIVRVILALWLVSSAFIVYFLLRVDWVVHDQLYSFGLRFSLDWANNYWAFVRAIYIFLTVPAFLSAVYLGLDILSFVKSRKVDVDREPEQVAEPVQKIEEREASQVIKSCPHCKRSFSRSLIMLDFSGGKTRLVNVCPYCNRVIGVESKESGAEFVNVDFEEVTEE